MKTNIEKIFQLLVSNNKANHALAMQLLKSQKIEEIDLFARQGLVKHEDMLVCLRYIENLCVGIKQPLSRRMYIVANEIMEFIK
ncbi:hypothetical protein [uncultured Microscilla sp.]|uniref:hypothetical protein n=1 Tax=uncultured Microscilla sp. TaxID=432653 RepID=UPI002605A715|nr:hypothetical protein [uncultured Microscilla sp.]